MAGLSKTLGVASVAALIAFGAGAALAQSPPANSGQETTAAGKEARSGKGLARRPFPAAFSIPTATAAFRSRKSRPSRNGSRRGRRERRRGALRRRVPAPRAPDPQSRRDQPVRHAGYRRRSKGLPGGNRGAVGALVQALRRQRRRYGRDRRIAAAALAPRLAARSASVANPARRMNGAHPRPAAEETDDGLVLRLADGCGGAMAALSDRHLPSVLACAWRILGDRAEAEDVARRPLSVCFGRRPSGVRTVPLSDRGFCGSRPTCVSTVVGSAPVSVRCPTISSDWKTAKRRRWTTTLRSGARSGARSQVCPIASGRHWCSFTSKGSADRKPQAPRSKRGSG